MGRVAGSYGVRGWIKVAPGGGVAKALAGAKEWWIGARGVRGERSARIHGATVVAKLAGLENREQALALKGARRSRCERDALPEPEAGHYYLADLVGLEVVNEQGERLGTVKRVDLERRAGRDGGGGRAATRLIPWVRAVVKEVDLPKQAHRGGMGRGLVMRFDVVTLFPADVCGGDGAAASPAGRWRQGCGS